MSDRSGLYLVPSSPSPVLFPLVNQKGNPRSGVLRWLLPGAALLLALGSLLRPVMAQTPAPLVTFLPGTQSTLVSGFVDPQGVAIDSSGNLYVADADAQQNTGTSFLYKETKSGGSYNRTTIAGGFIAAWGVAVDSRGNVYVADAGNPLGSSSSDGALYKETPGSPYIQTKIGSGFVSPTGVAVDSKGNIYIADIGCSNCNTTPSGGLYKETLQGDGSYTQSTILSSAAVSGVTVDSSGNLYVSIRTTSYVYKETLQGDGSYTQSTVASGFLSPVSVAVDPSGNVYVADDNSQTGTGAVVYKETLSGGSYTQSELITNLFSPEDLVLDGIGNLYIADITAGTSGAATAGAVFEEDYATPPSLSFPNTNVGVTSSAQTVTINNIGNAPLDFEIPSSGNNPSITSGFILSDDSGDCPLVTSESGSAGTLPSGASCPLTVAFAPQATGNHSGSLVLTDNNANGASPYTTQTIGLSGTGTRSAATAMNMGGAQATPNIPFIATAKTVNSAQSFTTNQIVFTTSNGQTGPASDGTRVEQFGVSGSTVVSASEIDLADGSQADDSGINYTTTGVAVDTALGFYYVFASQADTGTNAITIQRGTLTGGLLSTVWKDPLPNQDNNANYPETAITGGLALNAQTNQLYFAQGAEDVDGNTVAADTGIYVANIASNGTISTPTLLTSTTAGLVNPDYVVIDSSDNLAFFTDSIVAVDGFPATDNLDEVNLTTGAVTVMKSFFSTTDTADLLQGLAISDGTLYLTTVNYGNNTSANNQILSIPITVSGSGATAKATAGTATTLYSGANADQPSDIVIDAADGIFYTTGKQYISTGDLAGNYYGAIYEGSLSGGTSLTEVLSMSAIATNGNAAEDTNAVQLVLLTPSTGQAPAITSANSSTFTVGTSGTFTVTASGTPSPTFSESGTLPSGVTLTTAGVLSGTPAAATGGSYPITITASNGTSPNATQTFTLTVDQAPAITSANSTTFAVGTSGTFTATATGYPSPTFSESGTLPSGVTLTTAGVLSGTPAASTGGSYPITITASNGVGTNATQSFTLTVSGAPAITSASSTTFTAGTLGSFTVTASGYPTPTFSVTTGALPSGITLSSAGVLSGTPAAVTDGSYSITITATNGISPNATQNFTLTVDQSPAITSANSATFAAGASGTFTVTATGSPVPTLTETGALPSGVTLTSAGVLSGTPSAGAGGTYPITITASNGVGSNATQNFTLTVDQASLITSVAHTTFTVGTSGSFIVTATGFPAPTISEIGALPNGVTLSSSGVLSGTPAAGTAGTYTLTITASNGVGTAATQNFTLTVGQVPAITSAASSTFTVGTAGTFTVTATGSPTPTFSESGALPSGVTLTSGGVLSGTPAANTGGTYPIVITASNGVGTAATQNFILTVDQSPAITSANNVAFTAGTQRSFSVTAFGYPSPTFSETGTLPSGVVLSSAGVLSGTPAAGTGGTYSITITAANGISPNATQSFTLTVDQALAITSAASTTFTVGTSGAFTVTGTGFPAPTFSETGALPTGVTFTSAGLLSGTPAAGAGGTYSITIIASDGVNANATQNFTLTVGQAPAITSANNATFAANQAGAFTVTTVAFPTAALSESGALPSGVTFTDNGNGTATLAGTPGASTAGPYPFTITAGNGIIPNATQNFTLIVNPPPSYMVTTATDDASGVAVNCPSGGGGLTCSLRDALAAASAANGAAISFDPTVFAAGNTAAQNTITLGSGGTLSIPSNTTITGSAAGITIAGGGPTSSYAAFMVAGGVTGATINGLTITNAYTTGSLGAAFFVQGALTVTNSTVSGNTAQGSLSYGGGFYVTGSLTLIDSTVAGNSASNGGGGIFNQGSVSVIGSTIANNTAGTGGGILNDGGTVSLANSILSGNSGGDFSGSPAYSNNGGNEISVSGISLAPLGNYGGPTQTMIPLPGSAAICAINPSSATGTDQRGEPRTTTYGDTTCQDAGSVQSNYALSFSTDPPANVLTGTSFGAGVTLDESGSPFVVTATPLPTITIPLTLNGNGTLTGGSATVNDATGIATYSGLQVSQAGNDTLTATLTLNPTITPTALSISATSNTFDVALPVPTVTGISPNIGPATGGTLVTITGTNFTGATAVDFGASAAINVVVVNSTAITATSPPGTGIVDVTVTTPGGTSATTPADQFTYTVPPTLTEAFLPTTINIGTSTRLTFTITNPNVLALTGVSFSDALPVGLTIATTSNLTNTCGGTATATPGGGSIMLSGASVPANGACTLSANVTAITSGTKVNTTSPVASSQSLPGNGATATLTVNAMTLLPSAGPLPGGTVAIAYSQQFTASNGASPYTYTISAGSLPAGIALNSATGLLSGTPTAGGSFSFSVQAEDNNSNTVTQAYTLNIAAPTIVLSPNSLPAGTYGTAYSQTITASGGIAPYTYQISAGSLPTGLTLNSTTGVLSGTPSANGMFSFTVEATDSSTAPGHYSGSVAFVLSIGKATLAITANNATKVYGTANPTFTGTVTGQQNGDTFTESFQTTATLSSPVSSYTIVPSVTGTDLADYTQSVTDGMLTVTQAGTTTTLGVSSTSITPGQNETLMAQVASTTTGTPTGTVSFYDGTSLLSTVPLSGGAASYSTTTLAPGITHIITAVYNGDPNFTTSSSTSSASITVAPLDFTMTINGPSSSTVVPGRSITYQVTVTPDYGSYAGTVNFAVSGLPPGATATFSPSGIAANGGTQTVTVTIQTASATALTHVPPAPSPDRHAAPISLALLALFGLGGLRRRGRALKRFLCIVALLTGGAAATLSLSGCGSGNGFFDQAPQNYNITITATAGNLQHSVNVMLNVQ